MATLLNINEALLQEALELDDRTTIDTLVETALRVYIQHRKRTEMAVDIVRQIEAEGNYPQVDYAFDQGVLSHPLTTLIESSDKHWVSEIEKTRLILCNAQWQQVQGVAEELRQTHPESFQHKKVRCRNDEIREVWVFSKVVRLKKYGRKRLAIVHERADLSDAPRFLLTDALHWDSSRIFSTWSFRWPAKPFISLPSN